MYPTTGIQGTLTAAPCFTTFDDGVQVTTFQIACNNRHYDSETNAWVDGPATLVPCLARGYFARVVARWTAGRWSEVAGTLHSERCDDNDGRCERLVVHINVIEDSLMFDRGNVPETDAHSDVSVLGTAQGLVDT